jgi:hypothetical protein
MFDFNGARGWVSLAAGIILAVMPGAAQIPVNSSGSELNTPGALYVMASDVFCTFAPGVKITADNVIFDLGGHKLQGPGFGSGIINAQGFMCVAITGVQIRNGTITNWTSGIDLCAAGPISTNSSILNMSITGNIAGIRLINVADNTIRDSTISDNNKPDPTVSPVFSGQRNLFVRLGREQDQEQCCKWQRRVRDFC